MEMKNFNSDFINEIEYQQYKHRIKYAIRLNIFTFFFYSCSTNRLIDYSFCSIYISFNLIVSITRSIMVE